MVEFVESMLQLNPNKRLLQTHLQDMTGKPVTLRDITNIRVRHNSGQTRNNLEAVVDILRKVPGRKSHMIAKKFLLHHTTFWSWPSIFQNV